MAAMRAARRVSTARISAWISAHAPGLASCSRSPWCGTWRPADDGGGMDCCSDGFEIVARTGGEERNGDVASVSLAV